MKNLQTPIKRKVEEFFGKNINTTFYILKAVAMDALTFKVRIGNALSVLYKVYEPAGFLQPFIVSMKRILLIFIVKWICRLWFVLTYVHCFNIPELA